MRNRKHEVPGADQRGHWPGPGALGVRQVPLPQKVLWAHGGLPGPHLDGAALAEGWDYHHLDVGVLYVSPSF